MLVSNSGRFRSKVYPRSFQIGKQLNSIQFDKMSVLHVINLDQDMSPSLSKVIEDQLQRDIKVLMEQDMSPSLSKGIEDQLQRDIKVLMEYEDRNPDFFKAEDLDKAFNELNHKPFGNRPLNMFKNDEM